LKEKKEFDIHTSDCLKIDQISGTGDTASAAAFETSMNDLLLKVFKMQNMIFFKINEMHKLRVF